VGQIVPWNCVAHALIGMLVNPAQSRKIHKDERAVIQLALGLVIMQDGVVPAQSSPSAALALTARQSAGAAPKSLIGWCTFHTPDSPAGFPRASYKK
jgi:hypothetical protein